MKTFRDEKVFKLVLEEARTYFMEARGNTKFPHVVLPLRVEVKGEMGETFHFVVVTARSYSELEIRH